MRRPADGRFAPSPTGPLHLGNLRTALLAWLFARSSGSRFLMRIEDLDRERSRRDHEARQLADLRSIGLDWDGEPLRQSTRDAAYAAALAELTTAGRVYRCWCTRAEIRAAASAPHGPLPEGAYPGTCRRLPAARLDAQERSGRPPALRLDAGGTVVSFRDGVRGAVEGAVDDFVLQRGDGTFSYNLAVVVDDAHQGVAEVVRGDDLLDSTPRQLLLARLLGLPEPRHAHVPLVLGPDRRRLAKRHGAVTLADRLARGETPEAVVGWMAATLGLAGPGERLRPADLLGAFDPGRLPREPTVWPAGAASGS